MTHSNDSHDTYERSYLSVASVQIESVCGTQVEWNTGQGRDIRSAHFLSPAGTNALFLALLKYIGVRTVGRLPSLACLQGHF